MKKQIKQAPDYFISDSGQVENQYGRILKPDKLINGYLRIELSTDKVKNRYRIHRLVAEYFIPNPDNKTQVNHKDGNKENNNVDNLEWVTNSENMIHALNNGLLDHSKLKLSAAISGSKGWQAIEQLDLNGNIIASFVSVHEAKRITGIQMSGVLSGRYKTAGGFIWRYKGK